MNQMLMQQQESGLIFLTCLYFKRKNFCSHISVGKELDDVDLFAFFMFNTINVPSGKVSKQTEMFMNLLIK